MFTMPVMARSASGGGPPPGTPHVFWRLLINAPDGSGSFCGMTELQLRGTVGGPDLTSPAAPIGATAVSSVINFSNEGYMAFDDNLTTGWLSAVPTVSWIRYDFVTAGSVAQDIVQIAITGSYNAPDASPMDFELQWADFSTGPWTTVMTVIGETGWTGASDTRLFTV